MVFVSSGGPKGLRFRCAFWIQCGPHFGSLVLGPQARIILAWARIIRASIQFGPGNSVLGPRTENPVLGPNWISDRKSDSVLSWPQDRKSGTGTGLHFGPEIRFCPVLASGPDFSVLKDRIFLKSCPEDRTESGQDRIACPQGPDFSEILS